MTARQPAPLSGRVPADVDVIYVTTPPPERKRTSRIPMDLNEHGFFLMANPAWESMRDRLPRPLTTEEAAMDLRWQFYQGPNRGRMPEHPELAEYWGWRSKSGGLSIKRVRNLKRSEIWRDAYADARNAEAEEGQGEGRPGAGQGQGKGSPGKEQPGESDTKGQGKGRARAGQGQPKGHTRGVGNSEQEQEQQQDSEKRRDSEIQRDSAEREGSAPPVPAAPGSPPGLFREASDPPELSRKLRAALQTAGLTTLGDLEACTRSDLRRIRGVGPRAVEQIEALLAAHGRSLSVEPEPTVSRGQLQQRLIGAWCRAWKQASGTEDSYPLDRQRDLGHALRWAGMLGIEPTSSLEEIDAAVGRFEEVAHAYCIDALAGRVRFPSGAPTTQKLSTILAERLQQGAPTPPSPGEMSSDDLAAELARGEALYRQRQAQRAGIPAGDVIDASDIGDGDGFGSEVPRG